MGMAQLGRWAVVLGVALNYRVGSAIRLGWGLWPMNDPVTVVAAESESNQLVLPKVEISAGLI